MSTEQDNELRPMDGLAHDLRALDGPCLLVPSYIDESVLAMAQRRMARSRRTRQWAVAGAMAAAVVLAVGVVGVVPEKTRPPVGPSAASGPRPEPVDVLDLYALARKIEMQEALGAQTGVQGEGMTGTDAVAALARIFVASPPASPRGIACDGITHRVCVLDVYLDSGNHPLAAYQVELNEPNGRLRFVGVEGGAAAFKDLPYYDPRALQHTRIVLAAFSTGQDLPTGMVRVARLYGVIVGDGEPDCAAKLTAAATANGKRIPARLMVVPVEAMMDREGPAGVPVGFLWR
jgi:hypothetical protein